MFPFLFDTAQIESRVGELGGLWDKLAVASETKGSKLQEAAQQQQYNRAVEDIELWLSEVEGQLLSEDYGKVGYHRSKLKVFESSSWSLDTRLRRGN